MEATIAVGDWARPAEDLAHTWWRVTAVDLEGGAVVLSRDDGVGDTVSGPTEQAPLRSLPLELLPGAIVLRAGAPAGLAGGEVTFQLPSPDADWALGVLAGYRERDAAARSAQREVRSHIWGVARQGRSILPCMNGRLLQQNCATLCCHVSTHDPPKKTPLPPPSHLEERFLF